MSTPFFKNLLRFLAVISMVMSATAITPVAFAAADSDASDMPLDLQLAILEDTAEPFVNYRVEGHGLTYQLKPAGLQAKGPDFTWSISLSEFGRGSQVAAVAEADINQVERRMEYRRGALTEWYRDTVLGVQQGFTIHEAPGGRGEIVLQLDLSTDLAGALDEDGRGLSFAAGDGQTLRYDHLTAFDANGAELAARMTYQGERVLIQVDDRGASYPIMIDPLIYLEAQVIASDAATNDYFGGSVAVSGDTAVVGSYGKNSNQGAAYVFIRSGTAWSQQGKLTASDGAAWDYFGASVSISGDTVVIGDYRKNTSQGAAYVFTRSGTVWSQQQKLTASDGVYYDNFGTSVAISGDTAIIGANGKNVTQGATYVFTRTGTTWSQQGQLAASDGAPGDYFGDSVAISGDTAIIGASSKNSYQGAAYVFTRTGITWSQQSKLTASDDAADDRFGYSVAISENTVVIGASLKNSFQGAAYVFTRSGTTWSQQGKLTASDGAADDRFGGSVAVSGDTAVIGALTKNSAQGAAYVFTRTGTTWNQQQKLTASDGASVDYFGSSVAFDGVVVVGAKSNDLGGVVNAGSAYIYYPYNTDADLMVNQVVSDAAPDAGQAVMYTITVTNLGSNSAGGVAVFDKLPPGLTYISSIATSGAYDPRGGSWNLTNLPVGASATLVINATVNNGTGGQAITNIASLLGLDANLANNSASATIVVNQPQVAFSPSPLTFDPTPLNTNSAVGQVRVTNNGTATLHVIATQITSEFSITYDSCTAATLPPGENCWVWVLFTPTAVGTRTGSLFIYDDAPGSPQALSLSGTGAFSQLTAHPSSLTFGNTEIGAFGATQTVRLSNTSNFPVTLASVAFSGPFSQQGGTCGLTLAANSSCTYGVRFSPTDAGPMAGQMLIYNDTPVSPLIVNLSGVGAQGFAVLTPATPVFDFEPVGVPAPVVMVKFTNSGQVAITLSGIELTEDFTNSGTGTCTSMTILAPRTACTIGIVFTPSDLGVRTGTLTVTSNASNSPTILNLSGIGATDYITNGGMETDVASPIGIPDNWTAAGMTVSSTIDGLDTAVFYNGAKSMRIAGATGKTKTLTQTITDSGSVGLPLRLSLWTRGNAIPILGGYKVIMQLYVGSTVKKTFTFNLPIGTYGFTQKSFKMTSPVAYTKITVQINSMEPTGSTMWVDDVG